MKNITPERLDRLNRRKILADVILIIVVILIGVYIIMNLEAVKQAKYNPCYLCEQQEGAYCMINGEPIIWEGEELEDKNMPIIINYTGD